MVTPYLTFAGNCGEALEFYQAAFHSNIKMTQLYNDYVPEGISVVPDHLSTWILHAEMEICGTNFWFADEVVSSVTKGNMVKLTAQVQDAKEAQRIFDMLNNDAIIILPPVETFYSTFHAGLTDRFGVSWNITALESPDA